MTKEKIKDLAEKFVPGGFSQLTVFQGQHGEKILERFSRLSNEILTLPHLNQVLHLSNLPGIGEGFFKYYFLEKPQEHPYSLDSILTPVPDLHPTGIHSFDQLEWGIRRFLTDALLFFGSLTTSYSELAQLSFDGLSRFFALKAIDADQMKSRGPTLPLEDIPMDDRYLIAELACKAYDVPEGKEKAMISEKLLDAYSALPQKEHTGVTIRKLLDGSKLKNEPAQTQLALRFAVEEIVEQDITSEEDLKKKIDDIATRFSAARKKALRNSDLYLSLANDLDVYVATSMRNRQDFREMANSCTKIFEDDRLKSYNLRYFDPTKSACMGHEDKGIIECLMVKCAKVLIYFAGEKESFGKDSEAAMALSQGKPVIIMCPDTEAGRERMRFFRDVHPLSRMIDMRTGVPVGAMITNSIDNVVRLLQRVFNNAMEYQMEHDGNGYFRLKEKVTESVVRLQTNSRLLRDTFWNYYHGLPPRTELA